MLAHTVFFTLKDPTEQNIAHLVAQCDQWIKGEEGLLYYAAGKRADVYQRPVNDQAFHVALITVFASRAAHDAYQATSVRHKTFIEANKPTWASLRVFDADIEVC